ncbi:MAG: endo-1,4-beta-xylanase [Phycisphaeraceae bacterium]|nr:endo-1,4-beta-xylanase [Phycisphaeraceae bacterium]
MLSFAVFQADRVALDPRSMYLLGQDETPMPGRIALDGAVIRVERQGDEPTGLSLVIDVDMLAEDLPDTIGPAPRLGQLTLETCLLPHRERPYLLTLELARRRVMLMFNKIEEWALFDLPEDHPIMVRFEHAHRLFSRALVAHRREASNESGIPEEADGLARWALVLAIDAGERLALAKAERLMPDRLSGALYEAAVGQVEDVQEERVPPGAPVLVPGSNGVILPGRPQLGCAIGPAVFSEALTRIAAGTCDFVSMPMRWSGLEPKEGTYAFASTDKWIEWAVRTAKMPVAAGPIIDFRSSSIPDWLYVWENDYDTLRDLVAEHVKQVVTRYRRTVRRWNVLSGLSVGDHFPMTFEQMVDLTRMCVLIIRKLHPTANVIIELTRPWGEYAGAGGKRLAPRMFGELLLQAEVAAGFQIDGLGLRFDMACGVERQTMRDLMSFSALLDRYALLEKPLLITAIGAPSEEPQPAEDQPAPGRWHEPWTEASQAEWVEQAFSIAISKPFVHSVCWEELYDHGPDGGPMPGIGLVTRTGAVRPVATRLAQIRRALREGRSPVGVGANV